MKLKVDTSGVDIEANKDDYNFIQKLVPPELLGMFNDQLESWRWHNQVRLLKKIQQKAEMLKIEPKEIAPKFLFNFFEKASLEDSENLQEMWTNLLLNEAKSGNVNNYYIEILNQLTSQEAKFLNNIYDVSKKNSNPNRIVRLGEKANPLAYIFIRKFYAFQLLKPARTEAVGIKIGDFSPLLDTVKQFEFTELGNNFMEFVTDIK